MRGVVRCVAASFAVMLLPAALAAQAGGTVSGRVIDQATQRPVQDVQMIVVGTQRGTQTDQNGRYSIAGIPAGPRAITARRVGYAPKTSPVTVTVGQTASLDFTIAAAVLQLQEVVVNAVTGQSQRRSEVGVNTGYIDVATLNQGAITKFADVLQGRVAGVNLQQAAGSAGSSQRIRIRGANSLSLSNEPLLYVDGVLISNSKGGISLGGQDYSRLNDINPEEIENVEVLKGPAASAIYGSAAASGVILLTTKRGRAGATVWRGYAEGGTQKDVNTYPLNYAALTAFDASKPYYDIADGGILNTRSLLGSSAPYDICPNYRAGLAAGTPGACKQDIFLSFDQFRDPRTTPYQSGYRNKAGVNASGGSEALTFFLSGDKEKEEGVLRPNGVDRTSFRSNLNARLSSNVTAAVNVAYVTSATNRISNDNSIFSPLINSLLGPAQYFDGLATDSVGTPGNRLGSYFGYSTTDQRLVTADQGLDRFITGANINYTPFSWLRLNGNAGVDMFSRFDRRTISPAFNLPLAQSYILGFRDASRATNHLWTSNASATGTFPLTDRVVSTTTLGGSFQRTLFETADCYGVGIPAGTTSCSATTSQFAVGEQYSDERTLGLFARQEFAISDKLFLAGSVRADNNSGLSRDISGLSYFPSMNVSYIISKESFFPQVAAISSLRLRAAVGQAGQRPAFGNGETFFSSTVTQVGGAEKPALVLTNTGNPALKVERTTEMEGGFDAGFLDDRITAEYTAFSRRSKDALISRDLAPSAGLTGSVFQNLGSIRNSGQEFGLGFNVLDRHNLRFSTHMTATTLHSNIENLGAGIAPIQFNRGAQAHREGFPTGAFFALPIKYNDADGNGILTRNEVSVDSSKFLIVPNAKGGLDTLATSYIGPALPTNTQSISGDVTLFKLLTITTLFERRAGNRQNNFTEYFRCRQQAGNAYFSQCAALSNPKASLASQAAFLGAQFLSATPYGYIEDASFVKWRELTFRLEAPYALGNRFSTLRGAAVSISGRNLKTWTKYSGLDPEINESGGNANFTQDEFNTQPPVRTITVRVDFKP